MNHSTIRRILLAKAIEEQEPPKHLLSEAERETITNQALFEVRPGQGKSATAPRTDKLLAKRADLILSRSLQKKPQLQKLLNDSSSSHLLQLGLPFVALLLGFTLDRVADPHRINVLSWPLMAILVWNLLAYCLLPFGNALLTKKPPVQLHTPRWKRLFFGKTHATGSIEQIFQADWQTYASPIQRLQWQQTLHLCAATLAIGTMTSLWINGLFTEYRIGWESTFLRTEQVNTILNIITTPAQYLLGMAPWSLEQIRELQSWPAGNQINGIRWVQTYSVLLLLIVIAPRLLLALALHWRARSRASKAQLPLQQAYFQKLLRDIASEATNVHIIPYSLQMSEARTSAVKSHVHHVYGAAAQCHILPGIAYGQEDAIGKSSHASTQESTPEHLPILLFNLSATPEREGHGKAIERLLGQDGSLQGVWLYSADYAQRLNLASADGSMRLNERKHLWQNFLQTYGLNADFMGH